MSIRKTLALVFSAIFCTSCQQSGLTLSLSPAGDPSVAPDGSVMAAWTQITGNSSPSELSGLARFIVAGTANTQVCGEFSLKASSGILADFSPRDNVAPAEFAVTVCETNFSPAWTSAALLHNGNSVNLWAPGSQTGPIATFPTLYSVGRRTDGAIKMATVGDTGCRDNGDQSCDTEAEWPFETLAKAATATKSDFVLHVGDYRYSHKGSDDIWTYWYQEFFYPAQSLLLDAPWAFVRGNHETCGYSGTSSLSSPWGTGWFYFLQHNTISNTVSCGTTGAPYQSPWYFDVGVKTGDSFNDSHRFIVMDSSNDDLNTQLTDNFVTMLDYSDSATSSWWAGHRPIWGIDPFSPVTVLEANLEQSLQSAITSYGKTSTCWPTDNLPCSLKTVITGHIHNLERIQFFDTGTKATNWLRPQQYIIGNTGVDLDPAMQQSPCSFTVPQGDPGQFGANLKATVDWAEEFGFSLWQRPATGEPSGWSESRHFYENGAMKTVMPAQLNGNTNYPVCQ